MQQMVSITDLRKGANRIIKNLHNGSVLVLVSNTCKAVMISPEEYDNYKKLLDDQDIITSTKEAEKHGEIFTSSQEAISHLSSL